MPGPGFTKNPGCQAHKCMGSLMRPPPDRPVGTVRPVEEVKEHALKFIKEYYENSNKLKSQEYTDRLKQVEEDISRRGTYELTYEELCFGAKTAWRNAPRCIGRIQWKNLRLIDARDATTTKDMYDVMLEHLEYAFNEGNIRSCITIFPQRSEIKRDFRVWNPQLISFAGYMQPDGTVIGDPAYVEFTEMCTKLGWKGDRTNFDVLPWVLQAQGGPPEYFELPKKLATLVNIKHPTFKWFEQLQLKWYAVPAVANMLFDCGGIEFPAAPFSGWYMGSEVGSRDFCDESRYNITEKVGRKMGLDVGQNVNLWKDKVLVEVNIAVLHSYRQAGVTMVDHHTASEQFMSHLDTEYRVRGGCPADWVWIVPPMSSSITPVYHMEMLYYKLKPSYEYQNEIWRSYRFGDERQRERKLTLKIISKALVFGMRLALMTLKKRTRCTILYATETGKSQLFSKEMQRITSFAFNTRMLCMDEYDFADLPKENLLLVIASTFGNGDPPDNGKSFFETLKSKDDKNKRNLAHIKFSVFALGSSAYPVFCAFGQNVDHELDGLGATRVYPVVTGDELQGQDDSFRTWAKSTFTSACESFSIDIKDILNTGMLNLSDETQWAANRYNIIPQSNGKILPTIEGLEYLHKKKLSTIHIKKVSCLESADKQKKTAFVQLTTNGEDNMMYQAGDHLAVFPCNNKTLVTNILKKLKTKLSVDDVVKIQRQSKQSASSGQWQNDTRLPSSVSLRTALTYFLDVVTPPTQQLVAQYANLAKSNKEKTILETLAKDRNAYSIWRFKFAPNLLDILNMFSSVKPEPSFLLTQLPILQQRYYSISSTPSLHQDSVHLTVAVVMFKTESGAKKQGLCSSWLSELKPGEEVIATIRSVPHFHMPKDPKDPIIMVGPGTGIAPLRSFWEERYFNKTNHDEQAGQLSLYYGCRYSKGDNLYREEKMQMVKEGVMTENLALSREPGVPKTYVQDLLTKNGRYVCQDLVHNNGHVYVCGDVEMAADVKSTILNILKTHGNMTEEKAKETMETLRSKERYHEDIFGTLKAPAPKVENGTTTAVITPAIKAIQVRPTVGDINDSDDDLPPSCLAKLRMKKRRSIIVTPM